jgi:hypothetical protein
MTSFVFGVAVLVMLSKHCTVSPQAAQRAFTITLAESRLGVVDLNAC